MKQETKATIGAAGIAGAVVVIASWLLHQYAGVDVPAEVAGAATMLLGAALAPLMHAGV